MTRLSAFGDRDEIDAELVNEDQRAEREQESIGAYYQALDERDFDLAETARLEVLGLQREMAYDAADAPF